MRPQGPCNRLNAAPIAATYWVSRASAALGQCMLPVIWKRRRMSAGHRSRMWLGVSCSSLQRGQNPPRHAGLRHCGHSGTGLLPCRCWVEPAQWPALIWWTSTERKRSRPITGGGTVVPIRWRTSPGAAGLRAGLSPSWLPLCARCGCPPVRLLAGGRTPPWPGRPPSRYRGGRSGRVPTGGGSVDPQALPDSRERPT